MPLCGQRKNRRFSKETPKTKRVRVTPLDRSREKTVTRVTAGRISVFEPPLSETPSTKPQAPEKFQISKHQTPIPSHLKNLFELGQVPWAVASDVGNVFQTDPTQFRIIKPRLDRHDVAGAQS